MKILIAGASGLVGSHLLQLLEADDSVSSIFVLARKEMKPMHAKTKIIKTNFDNLSDSLKEINAIDASFSCLGTTKSKTPDEAQYYKLEIEYPTQIAKWTQQHGGGQMHFISSIGANLKSKNEYLFRKAIAEKNISEVELAQSFFYRPSLILGTRKESRVLEKISEVILKLIQPILFGKNKKYRAIHAQTIAQSMVENLKNKTQGVHILESDKIQEIVDNNSKQ